MGFWDFLSTGKTAEKAMDVVDKTTDGIIRGIDAAWFTKEEKAAMHMKMLDYHLELMKTHALEDTAKGMTRRYLSFMFCGVFLLMLIVAAAMWRWDPTWAQVLLDIGKALSTLVMAVVIFYFGMFAFSSGVKTLKGGGD